ncbi:MAG TPA: sigma 54-interacting transcriptional regulator [Bryobacteraceae bacterium]|jgi:transcriptional regulator with PAS, ATPase and Fis domain|nr:sigma 54-interacting transcriptional regulator [Bryobacteraceae bacterium]
MISPSESVAVPRQGNEPGTVRCETFLGMPAVVASPEMQSLLDIVVRIAASNASVLITGETGTGKELVARSVHHFSQRSDKPWVDINCAALPQTLLESELFGYEKGAFSGADGGKPGLFEVANGGTLFLDEIGELDLAMQVKLLRALDGVAYYRLGGTRKVKVNVRIVAATNVDLAAAVEKGLFRRDLFHRLEQVRLEIPPLRQRRADILPLAHHFLSLEAAHRHFSEACLAALERYSWPGNVRELRNTVVRAACLAQSDEIQLDDLPEGVRSSPQVANLPAQTMEALEQQAIFRALTQSGCNQDKAARLLGISRRTLIRKLKSYRERFDAEVCVAY